MSVEKMEMMNVIGHLNELDRVSSEIVKSGCVHIVNALNEINQNNFPIITPEQNINILMDLGFMKQYVKPNEDSDEDHKINELMDFFKIDKKVYRNDLENGLEHQELVQMIESIYSKVRSFKKDYTDIQEEIKKAQELKAYFSQIKDIKIDFNALKNLNHFSFSMGKLTRDNYSKLKENIENVSSIIYDICTVPGYQVIMSITPKILEAEVDRIFKSLNYEEIVLPEGLSGTSEEIVKKLTEEIGKKKGDLESIRENIDKIKEKYLKSIRECYSTIKLYEKIWSVNNEVACTSEYFYMAGWVPASEKKNLQERLKKFSGRMVITFKPQSEMSGSSVPPTKLKNNWFVRPFETFVGMYGFPSYNEMDPTNFVAISYMIMFGCMFGDIGQGLVFLLTGILMTMKNRESTFGGILSRIGISSMIFGALFGSVFGNENVFHHLLVKPLDNINAMLLGGIGIGVALTTVSYIYSIINAEKRKDLEEGVFGKNGIVGFLFYWLILLTAVSVAGVKGIKLPLNTMIIVLCILLMLMVFKQPLANLITNRRPLYADGASDYYVASGFGVVETLLSMLSNSISFIRVGAFALNHAGLFLAFATLAGMVKSSAGSVGILVLGNIIIIGLEGLIVFIQGLRLEYYELFSKYYEGEGIEYSPVRLQYAKETSDVGNVREFNQKQIQSMNA